MVCNCILQLYEVKTDDCGLVHAAKTKQKDYHVDNALEFLLRDCGDYCGVDIGYLVVHLVLVEIEGEDAHQLAY